MPHGRDSYFDNNRALIAQQILMKQQQSRPYYATRAMSESILTPYDHFPYKYFYRGDPYAPNPVVMEREAGYRPLNNECYRVQTDPQHYQHSSCWATPCSTVFPCCPGKELKNKQVGSGDQTCENRCNQLKYQVLTPP